MPGRRPKDAPREDNYGFGPRLGTDHPASVFRSERQVSVLRALHYEFGLSIAELSDLVGIKYDSLYHAIKGLSWDWLTYPRPVVTGEHAKVLMAAVEFLREYKIDRYFRDATEERGRPVSDVEAPSRNGLDRETLRARMLEELDVYGGK